MPEPSQLVLLDQLPTIATGTKVRFLGCVHAYDGQTGTLILGDHYPITAADAPTALVELTNVLDSVQHDLLAVGAWLNIMGYVRESPHSMATDKRQSRREQRSGVVVVDATMIWSAGAIKLDKYQSAVKDSQSTSLDR